MLNRTVYGFSEDLKPLSGFLVAQQIYAGNHKNPSEEFRIAVVERVRPIFSFSIPVALHNQAIEV